MSEVDRDGNIDFSWFGGGLRDGDVDFSLVFWSFLVCRRDGWRYRFLISFLIFWGGRGMEISIFQWFFKVPGVPEGWKYYVFTGFSRFLKWKHWFFTCFSRLLGRLRDGSIDFQWFLKISGVEGGTTQKRKKQSVPSSRHQGRMRINMASPLWKHWKTI